MESQAMAGNVRIYTPFYTHVVKTTHWTAGNNNLWNLHFFISETYGPDWVTSGLPSRLQTPWFTAWESLTDWGLNSDSAGVCLSASHGRACSLCSLVCDVPRASPSYTAVSGWRWRWARRTGLSARLPVDVREVWLFWLPPRVMRGFPGGSDSKESACSAGDPGWTPGSGRSPGEGNGHPLQYSCLGSPMDRGAWWARVHGVAKELDTP